jgi:hypothetical protein
MGNLIAIGYIDMTFFDPMAYDGKTADSLVTSPLMQGEYANELTDYVN